MASTLQTTNLTVTISEQLTSNGQVFNYENQVVLSNIKPFDPRVMTVPSSAPVSIIGFTNSDAYAGTFVIANVKYIRVTNKDDTNYVILRVTVSAGQTFTVRIDAGKSFMMGNPALSANINGAAFSAFVNADYITAQANAAPIDIEYFVASI